MDELLEWADDRPLFTVNEAQRATGMRRPSLREKLSRLARRDDLRRVERGKYTAHEDPLIYATYVEVPSFLSLWSGLRFYDLTTQQPTRIQVMCATSRPDLPEMEFFRSNAMFGYRKRPYDRFEVFVADEERLLIDCLARKQVPVTALGELVAAVDVETAVAYVDRFGRTAVAKRLGYLLEQVRGVTVESLRGTDRNYPLLDLAGPAGGDPDSRWRLRVNVNVDED